MALNDARAKQAMYMARKPAKSSLGGVAGTGVGSGRAIMFIAIGVAMAIAAIWLAIEMFH